MRSCLQFVCGCLRVCVVVLSLRRFLLSCTLCSAAALGIASRVASAYSRKQRLVARRFTSALLPSLGSTSRVASAHGRAQHVVATPVYDSEGTQPLLRLRLSARFQRRWAILTRPPGRGGSGCSDGGDTNEETVHRSHIGARRFGQFRHIINGCVRASSGNFVTGANVSMHGRPQMRAQVQAVSSHRQRMRARRFRQFRHGCKCERAQTATNARAQVPARQSLQRRPLSKHAGE